MYKLPSLSGITPAHRDLRNRKPKSAPHTRQGLPQASTVLTNPGPLQPKVVQGVEAALDEPETVALGVGGPVQGIEPVAELELVLISEGVGSREGEEEEAEFSNVYRVNVLMEVICTYLILESPLKWTIFC